MTDREREWGTSWVVEDESGKDGQRIIFHFNITSKGTCALQWGTYNILNITHVNDNG